MDTRTNKMKILCLLLILMSSSCVIAQSYRIDWNSVNSGGGAMSSATFKISGSTGQSAVDYMESASFMQWAGFWEPETSTPGGYTLSSTVHLGDYSGSVAGVPVTVDLLNQDDNSILYTVNTSLNEEGKFYIHSVQPGTYKTAIKPSHWLRKITGPVSVVDQDVDFVIQ